MMRLFLFSLLLASSALYAQSTTKYFVSFYREGKTQYFIKPIEFTGEQSKEELILDITFIPQDFATINFSLVANEVYKTVDSLVISNNKQKITITNSELLFNEKQKKSIESRFSSTTDPKLLNALFESNNWNVILYMNNSTKHFFISKKAKKSILVIQSELFTLL